MGWTIGKHRIELKATVDWLSVSIDDEPFKLLGSARILGDYPLRIGATSSGWTTTTRSK